MSRINGFLGRRDLLKVLGIGGAGAAVTAAAGGAIWSGQQAIAPVIAKFPSPIKEPLDKKLVDNAVIANVKYQAARLPEISTILAKRIADGKLKIVAGRYDLDTGVVNLV